MSIQIAPKLSDNFGLRQDKVTTIEARFSAKECSHLSYFRLKGSANRHIMRKRKRKKTKEKPQTRAGLIITILTCMIFHRLEYKTT